jgi:hypothetical protein
MLSVSSFTGGESMRVSVMGRSKRRVEWLPWYRARGYNGNLTEAEKRQLDAFRAQEKHPAASKQALTLLTGPAVCCVSNHRGRGDRRLPVAEAG